MAVRLEPAGEQDLDGIRALLAAAFNAPADASFLDERLLRWKYFESCGPDTLPRSYLLKQNDTIVAHCVALPLSLRLPGHASTNGHPERVSAVCFLDWAGGRGLPGAGAILMNKLTAAADVAIVAGGSDATRAAIGRLGFVARNRIDVCARVVRPVRQARTRASSGKWKALARLARNAAWSKTPLGELAEDWRAKQVESFTPLPDRRTAAAALPEHTPEYLNYWLRCPAATVTAFDIYQRDDRVGYFLLSRVGGQTRIALRLWTARQTDWEQAFRLAVRTATEDPRTCEIITLSSTSVTRAALAACGFRRRGTLPLFIRDGHGRLRDTSEVLWSAIDDDLAYVHDPAFPYWT
jgi:hypothetical protein